MKRTKFAFVIKYFVDYNKIFTELTDCTMKLSRINAYTRHLNGNNFWFQTNLIIYAACGQWIDFLPHVYDMMKFILNLQNENRFTSER